MANRRKLRETVLQALYACEVGSGDREHVLHTIIKKASGDSSNEEVAFTESLFLRTVRRYQELDSEIVRHLDNWELNRLAVIDRLILRMAICEMLEFEDIPPKVTINEAIEIAKEYSTSKSGRFINGILDSAYEQLNSEQRISKSGRGLLDGTPGKSESQTQNGAT